MTEPVPTDLPASMLQPVEFDTGPDEGMTYICGKPPGHEDAEVARLTSVLHVQTLRAESAEELLTRERTYADRMRAEVERAREVVAAAKAWRDVLDGHTDADPLGDSMHALLAAVDALCTDKEGADGSG